VGSERAGNLKQWGLALLLVPIVLDSVLGFLAKIGSFQTAPTPTAIIADPANRELQKIAEATARMLADLHAGTAPRNWENVPQWSVLGEKMDRLAETMQRLTTAAHDLSSTMREAGQRDRGSWRMRSSEGVREEGERASWLERFWRWLESVTT
jgi:hypothetical protein